MVAGDEQPPADDENRLAVSSWSALVILDLRFDACYFQRDKLPGPWRTGPIYVTSPGGGPPDYEGPVGEDVPRLMTETVDWLQNGDLDAHVIVRAAIAHLHVVSAQPFRDGNGRISRICSHSCSRATGSVA